MPISDVGTKRNLDHRLGTPLLVLLRPLVSLVRGLARRDHAADVRGRIVVLKLLGGGSLVIALPALLGLRRRHPKAPLILVTTRGVEPFARLLGLFDRILVIDDRSWVRFVLSTLRVWAGAVGADTTVDLEVFSRLSTVFSLLTLARNRIGFYLNDFFLRKGLNTHLVYFNRSGPAHRFYEQIAAWLGAAPATVEECRAHLVERLPPPSLPKGERPRFVVGHGCSGLGHERKLSPARWKTVLLSVVPRDKPSEVLFLGLESDRAEAEEIIGLASGGLPLAEFTVRCGALDLASSVSLLRTATRYVGIDSSLLHFARLLGVPSVSFWGPTSPRVLLGPVPGLEEDVRYAAIPCSPCIHVAETPPCRGRNLCMEALFDPDVLEKSDPFFTAWSPHEK